MKDKENHRLLYDKECKDCLNKTICESANTPNSCRKLTDRLRLELRCNYRKHRKIVSGITITTEHVYIKRKIQRNVLKEGIFTLNEHYRFGKPFLRAEISGKYNGGTFATRYFNW